MSIVTCSVADCERGGRIKLGMCSMHYQRDKKLRTPCSFPECANGVVYVTTGYCGTHHKRLLKHGDPNVTMKGKAHKVKHTADGLRICKACDEAKPISEYHKDSGGTDGLRAQCKDCRTTYMQGYYEGNVEQRREYMSERRKTHAEHVRAIDAARYERDKDKRLVLATEHSHIRRARIKEAGWERGVTVPALRKVHGDNCCYCGVEMTFTRGKRGTIASNKATLEHVLPISRGGTHTWDNAALACHRCNTSKNAKTVDEWSPNNGDITDRDNNLEACA